MGPAEAVSSPLPCQLHAAIAVALRTRLYELPPPAKHHSPGGWEETMHGTNLPRAYLGPHLHPATR